MGLFKGTNQQFWLKSVAICPPMYYPFIEEPYLYMTSKIIQDRALDVIYKKIIHIEDYIWKHMGPVSERKLISKMFRIIVPTIKPQHKIHKYSSKNVAVNRDQCSHICRFWIGIMTSMEWYTIIPESHLLVNNVNVPPNIIVYKGWIYNIHGLTNKEGRHFQWRIIYAGAWPWPSHHRLVHRGSLLGENAKYSYSGTK